MTQPYAVAQYVGNTANTNNSSNQRYNYNQQYQQQQQQQQQQQNEPDIFVPATAIAASTAAPPTSNHPANLPPFGASTQTVYPSATATIATVPAGNSAYATTTTATTATTPLATATPVKPDKIDTKPPASQNPTTTTTTTTYHIPSPSSSNSSNLPHAVEQRLALMKFHRKNRQAVAATTGAVVGLLFLGPIGAAVGGFASHQIVKHSGRAQERRARKYFEKQVEQQHETQTGRHQLR